MLYIYRIIFNEKQVFLDLQFRVHFDLCCYKTAKMIIHTLSNYFPDLIHRASSYFRTLFTRVSHSAKNRYGKEFVTPIWNIHYPSPFEDDFCYHGQIHVRNQASDLDTCVRDCFFDSVL